MPLYNLLYVVGIIFFATSTPRSSSIRMTWRRTCGSTAASSPGIRPGKRTAEYIDTILTRITLVGAIYLAMVAILPEFLISGFKVAPIPFIGDWLDARCRSSSRRAWACTFYFGGTSLLIVVGVAMDTCSRSSRS
jgi:preprotein translocase subunit SecY